VPPEGAFQRKNSDEIPVAHRSKSFETNLKRKYKAVIFFLSIFLFIGFLPFRSILFQDPEADLVILNSENEDKRLLGHFPYPEASPNHLIDVYPGLSIHKDTFKALMAMSSAAEAQGINLVLLSGFRSHDLQEEIFFNVKSARNQTAIERARVSAPPGFSEHSTGFAIDLGDGQRRETDFMVSFEETKAFKWLQRNAARYHFILSFPRGNPQGVSYEPWHWRYEGTAEALIQFEAARRLRGNN